MKNFISNLKKNKKKKIYFFFFTFIFEIFFSYLILNFSRSNITLLVTLNLVMMFYFIFSYHFFYSLKKLSDSKALELKRLNSLQEVIMVSETNINGKIEYLNKSFCQHYGFDKKELIGQSFRIINSGTHSNEFWENFWTTIKSGQIWKGLICNKNKKGDLLWNESATIPKLNSNGEIIGFIGLKVDITESKKINDQLNHNSKLATLGQLASEIAHEINNPLSILKNTIEVEQKYLKKGNIGIEYFSKSLCRREEALGRIINIVEGLKINARTTGETLKVINIHDVIDSILPMMQTLYLKQGILIASDFKAKKLKIKAKEGKLEQVIINLLTNAHDALENTKNKKITIRTINESGFVKIKVSDNGEGIPEEIKSKIFEIFFTTKEIGKGTGMGLSISSAIIKEMKGDFSIDSKLGNGSIFTISLPLTDEANL